MSKQQKLNEYLAEEIMKWEFRTPDWAKPDKDDGYLGSDYKCWHDLEAENLEELNITNEKYLYPDGSNNLWNPLENLEQAFEVLETYTSKNNYFWRLWNDEDLDYNISLSNPTLLQNRDPYRNISDKKTKAIIGVICKADKIYDDYEEVFN